MNESSPAPAEYQDRSAGLTVFGILTIILGAFCALALPLMLFSTAMAAKDPAVGQMRGTGFMIFFYLALAVQNIWLGIGSIMARRWARALLAIVSWGWLIMGVTSAVTLVFVIPKMLAEVPPPQGGKYAADMARMITGIIFAVMGAIFVGLPGVWAFFYSSKAVKATCEYRDPKERWTDRCPLPVLGASLWLLLGGVALLVMPLAGFAILPLFGNFVVGPVAIVVCLLVALLFLWAAWALYRLDIKGWWIAVVVPIIFSISTVLTYSRHDINEFYRLMGYPEAQITMMQKYAMPEWFFTWSGVIWMLPVLAYLVYIRRYFRKVQTA